MMLSSTSNLEREKLFGMGIFLIILVFLNLGGFASAAQTRSLKLYFVKTGQRAEIVFKKNGRYVPTGLKKLNRILFDWRNKKLTRMDPHLFDLLWAVYKSTGSKSYIHVLSGYRSPRTNAVLRRTTRGVARNSQHIHGRAIDFYIPGVSSKTLRNIALRYHLGGVGYYPRSRTPFVHIDVGSVRHWPRMSRRELLKVFPKGRTLHIPKGGKPLPGYATAFANYQARKKAWDSSSGVFWASRSKTQSDTRASKKSIKAEVTLSRSNSTQLENYPLQNIQQAALPKVFTAKSLRSSEPEEKFTNLASLQNIPIPISSPLRARNDSISEEIPEALAYASVPALKKNAFPGYSPKKTHNRIISSHSLSSDLVAEKIISGSREYAVTKKALKEVKQLKELPIDDKKIHAHAGIKKLRKGQELISSVKKSQLLLTSYRQPKLSFELKGSLVDSKKIILPMHLKPISTLKLQRNLPINFQYQK